MRFTRVRDLLAIAMLAGVACWLVVRTNYGTIPSLPTFAGLSLLVLAVVEAVLGFAIRSRVRARRVDKLLDPLMAARAVALAKASSLVAALMAGLWAGLLVYVVQHRALLVAAQHDTPGAIIGLVSSLALVGAALWLEHCCRTPTDDDPPPAR